MADLLSRTVKVALEEVFAIAFAIENSSLIVGFRRRGGKVGRLALFG